MLDLVFFPSHEFKADRIRWLVSLRFRASTLVENCLCIRHRTHELYFIFIPTSFVNVPDYILTAGHRAFPDPELTKDIILLKRTQ